MDIPTPRPDSVPLRPVRRGSGAPLWQQVRDDLLIRLDAGEFTEAFPGEHELRVQYRVSRHTVREALRELRASGLVTAARGQQPRLAARPVVEAPLGALYSLLASIEAAGLEQRSVVRGLEVHADAHVAVRLGLEESTPLLYLERLRLADGEPLAHDRVWLPASSTLALLQADFTHTALYAELARRCGIRLTGGEERIQAVIPTAVQRRLLGITPDVAALAIERLGCSGDRPVEWRTTLIRGDRFGALARFDARAGYEVRLGATGVQRPGWRVP